MMGHVTRLMRVCGLSLVLAGPAVADYVTGLDPQGDNFLSLRNGPGTGFARIMKLGPNTELTVLGSSGKWRKVILNDGTLGWAYGKYIAAGTPPTRNTPDIGYDPFDIGPVGQSGAARRAVRLLGRPNSGAGAVEALRKGGGVIVLGKMGGWLRVLSETGSTGYVAARDIAVGAIPKPLWGR